VHTNKKFRAFSVRDEKSFRHVLQGKEEREERVGTRMNGMVRWMPFQPHYTQLHCTQGRWFNCTHRHLMMQGGGKGGGGKPETQTGAKARGTHVSWLMGHESVSGFMGKGKRERTDCKTSSSSSCNL
jgi:hypothetical protein